MNIKWFELIHFCCRQFPAIFLSIIFLIVIKSYSPFLTGFIVGAMICFVSFQIYLKLHPITSPKSSSNQTLSSIPNTIFEIQAVKEYQPLQKFEVSHSNILKKYIFYDHFCFHHLYPPKPRVSIKKFQSQNGNGPQ